MLARCLRPFRFALAASVAFSASPSAASTSAAWEDFRRDVEQACRDAAAPMLTDPKVVVDPFGLESYGLAFLSGPSSVDGTPQSLVCVYDKVAKTVEIGGAMALEQAVPTLRPDLETTGSTTSAPSGAADDAGEPPEVQPVDRAPPPSDDRSELPPGVAERLLSPSALETPSRSAAVVGTGETPAGPGGSLFAGLCDAACSVTLDSLTETDRTDLLDLSAQIDRTIAANAAASLGAGPLAAREAAAAAAAAAEGEAAEISTPSAALAGTASCTLYYFGYQNEASRTVGTHQCSITEGEGGSLLVEKTSGERLRAEIEPLVGEVSAFVGRTFEADAELQDYDAETPVGTLSEELGNTVGFATEADGQLMLISSQRRRFEDSDTFFWVLAIDTP